MIGKFDNEVAEYVYSLSLDGCGDEETDEATGDSYTRVSFDEKQALEVNRLLGDATNEGRCCWFDNGPGMPEIITGYWGAILHEDDQGFVDVTLCPTSMEADDEWSTIESRIHYTLAGGLD